MTGVIGTLNNTTVAGTHTTTDSGSLTYFYRIEQKGRDDQGTSASGYNPAPNIQSISLTPTAYQQNTTSSGLVATIGSLNTTLPNSGLFQPNPNPTANYLVETNPRFANYRTWLSSDYLLQQLSYDPATTQKRIGDGFYEQSLVRDQVAQLTGRRFLDGYASDEAEYQGLLNNAVTVAKAWNLVPGVALSSEQVAQLTSDIVWLVQKTVTLPDGTTTQALVPQLYVSVQPGDLNGSGALISGNTTNLNISGDLNNSGTIAGRTVLVLNAVNVNNMGGNITATDVNVSATNDINNIGGTISGKDSLNAAAGRDLNVTSTTSTQSNNQGSNSSTTTNINRVAGLYVSNADAVLIATAGRDVNLNAAQISNSGTNINGTGGTLIQAGNNLNLGIVNTATQNNTVWDGKNHLNQGSTTDVGTSIQTSGNVYLNAGNDLNAKAANITSESGAIAGTAGNNINLTTGQATQTLDAAHQTKSHGFLSSKTITTRDNVNKTDSLGNTLSGDVVVLTAGTNLNAGQGDINVTGSNVVSTNGTTLNANNNINIIASQNTDNETHVRDVKKSGLLGGGGGIGFTIGSQQLTNTGTSQTTTNTASTVGSTAGDVNINTGKAYTQTGSDVLAPTGNVNITAQSVDINAAQNTSVTTQQTKFKQTGITVSISNPVVSAVQTASQMANAASQTSDPRMQALAAGTTALTAKNAYDAVQAGQAIKDGSSLDKMGGVTISVSLGTSKSQSDSTQTSSSAQGSNVTAGKDINITATGAGTASNLNVVGSTIQAADDVTLKADNQVNLLAAQNTDNQTSTNKSSSASVGVSYNTSTGFAVTASASQGKGHANGSDVSYTNTKVIAGNQTGDKATLQSGTDTNLIGAVVQGNQVVANVGTSGAGNLNVQSLQDTSSYDSKQTSSGFSVSVPIAGVGVGGSISHANSTINSNYASVNEQSGIKAGDGGFQVATNGNTNLIGAVIASTQTAIDNNKNSLTTKTLTTSNIQNQADYTGNAYSVSAGVGLNKQPNKELGNAPTASAGMASESGSANSITQSAISGGAVNITDNAQQTSKTGKDATTTVAMLDRDVHVVNTTDENGNTTSTAVDSSGNSTAHTITPIFDQEKVNRELNAAVTITQAFSQVAPKAVAEFAQSQYDKYKTTDPEEAAKWAEGGIYRIALHTALGGLITGDVSGALGAGAVASAAPLLNDLQDKVTSSLQGAGLSNDNAKTISQAVAELTSIGIGSAVGGTAGAGAALVVDTNNRQLHPSETLRIKQLAKGDPEKEAQLTAAACAIVRCADGVPVDSPEYSYLKALQDSGETLTAEIALLKSQKGQDGRTYGNLFQYTIGMDFQDYLDQNKISTRTLGAIQALGGLTGAAGSVALCDTGLGCAVGAVTGPISIDYGQAGLIQAITGEQQLTYGEQVLQSLGLSPQAAAYTYATLGLSPAAIDALAINKAVNAQAAYNALVIDSYANFAANGLKATPEVIASPQVQLLIKEIQASTPGMSINQAQVLAVDYIESGTAIPNPAIATQGSVLVKVVPAGLTPNATTGYWMSPEQARAIATMTPEQAAQVLGLPASQAAMIQSNGLNFYAISPKPGITADVFVSNIADASQGTTTTMTGGAQQVIVPNRTQWTNAVLVNPFTLRKAGGN